LDTGDCGRIADRPRSSEGLEVGLTVPGRPRCRVGALIGSTADQQGRWSLPGRERRSRRLGVGGWRFDEAAPGAIDSALDAALCTLSLSLSGRADRPGRPCIATAHRSGLRRTSRDAGPYLEAMVGLTVPVGRGRAGRPSLPRGIMYRGGLTVLGRPRTGGTPIPT